MKQIVPILFGAIWLIWAFSTTGSMAQQPVLHTGETQQANQQINQNMLLPTGPTPEQREQLLTRNSQNIARLKKLGLLPRINNSNPPSFIWPVQATGSVTDPGFYAIQHYVDHDTAFPDALQDYNCGTRTYDQPSGYNNQGTVIIGWPFGKEKMLFDYVEVVAAAPGTIINKQGGYPDNDCSPLNSPWNAIYIQHADGSVAWYGSLKNGSLTTKTVGQAVAQGEVLGIIGTSGNATYPQLHFEVYDHNNNLIDPFAGPCNPTTATSWFQNQPTYNQLKIDAVITGYDAPRLGSCHIHESYFKMNEFKPGEKLYMSAYFSNLSQGQVSNYKVFLPDSTLWL